MTEEIVDVAAVVVTHNSEDMVGALLDSLPSAWGPLSSRTIVVDNGSSDDTLALLEARGDCTVIRSENGGYAAGVNKGVHAARARSYLVLNPDATLGPGSVPQMLAALEGPHVGIVAPHITNAQGELFRSMRREPTLGRSIGLGFTGIPAFSEDVLDERAYGHPQIVDWALGAVLLISRECYDQLGGLDESYFLYSEETDFCLRARDQGILTLYTPLAHAMHVGGGSGQNERTHTMQLVNRVRLYRRRRGDTRAWLYLLVTLLGEVRRLVRGNPMSRAALRALVRPSLRPIELGCGPGLLPR